MISVIIMINIIIIVPVADVHYYCCTWMSQIHFFKYTVRMYGFQTVNWIAVNMFGDFASCIN